MDKDINRRTFLKGITGSAVGLAAMGMMGGVSAVAEAPEKAAPAVEGKKQFSGVHNVRHVTEDLVYLGVSDRRIELFENVYPIPRGVSYNSYLLLDEKTVLFDTVDRSVSGQFFENLEHALGERKLDFLIVNHMEPDHSSAIAQVVHRYPEVKILCTELAVSMIAQFHEIDIAKHGHTISEGMELVTGRHRLIFTLAPMVHWPEVMMTYDATDKILFSADAFGTFGAPGGNLFADEVPFETEWLADARRYYTNIVGKYGPQVQAVLAKAATLDIAMVCPLHGPIWRENIGWFIDKYDKWSNYTPEEDAVLVVYGSVYGGTENAAGVLASKLSEGGARNVTVLDVSKTHVSELIAESFRCSHIVLASITYNMGIFTPMKNFILDLQAHNLQNRCYAIVENGSWSPASGKLMRALMDEMPGMRQVGDIVTVRSTTNEESFDALCALAKDILASLGGAAPAAAAEPAAEAAVTAWRCTVCGYIYEGAELPADYACPLCGVGPDKFEPVS